MNIFNEENKICAIIITYNVGKNIENVVNAIKEQVTFVILIDNGSNSDTTKILLELKHNNKNVEVILNEENLGIAKAINIGVDLAKNKKCDWILTLDHDTICQKDMIKNMLYVYEKYNNKELIAMLSPKVFETTKKCYITPKEKGLFNEVNECIQSGSLIKLDVFDKIGYFNEKLFIYHVDYEFCERVILNKMKILQCNNTVIYHEEGYKVPKNFLNITTYYNNYSKLATYYISRNTIYMAKKYNFLYSKRILKDLVYITIFDKDKAEKLKYLFYGISDAIKNKYGKFNER